jgi:flavodoxin
LLSPVLAPELIFDKEAREVAMYPNLKILVIYFTRSGNTEQLAQTLASELGAECERIRERDGRSRRIGLFGFLRSLWDVLTYRPAPILSASYDVSSYDVVVIGTPVWAGRASTPVVTWMRVNREHLKHVAFFCSMGGRGSESAFDEMQRICGKVPLATCAIMERDISQDAERAPLEMFVRSIRRAIAVRKDAASMA